MIGGLLSRVFMRGGGPYDGRYKAMRLAPPFPALDDRRALPLEHPAELLGLHIPHVQSPPQRDPRRNANRSITSVVRPAMICRSPVVW